MRRAEKKLTHFPSFKFVQGATIPSIFRSNNTHGFLSPFAPLRSYSVVQLLTSHHFNTKNRPDERPAATAGCESSRQREILALIRAGTMGDTFNLHSKRRRTTSGGTPFRLNYLPHYSSHARWTFPRLRQYFEAFGGMALIVILPPWLTRWGEHEGVR